jgi:hypothetical protein
VLFTVTGDRSPHVFQASSEINTETPWSTNWLLFDRNIELTSVAQSIQIGTMIGETKVVFPAKTINNYMAKFRQGNPGITSRRIATTVQHLI